MIQVSNPKMGIGLNLEAAKVSKEDKRIVVWRNNIYQGKIEEF